MIGIRCARRFGEAPGTKRFAKPIKPIKPPLLVLARRAVNTARHPNTSRPGLIELVEVMMYCQRGKRICGLELYLPATSRMTYNIARMQSFSYLPQQLLAAAWASNLNYS